MKLCTKSQWIISILCCLLLGGWLAVATPSQSQSPSDQFTFPEAAEQIPFLDVKETFTVDPQYTEEARKAQLEGTVALYVEVPPYGAAENIRVLRGLGKGLDEKAVEAVRQWSFEPARKDGEAITSATIVLVDFHLPPEVKMTMGPATNAMTTRKIYRVGPVSGITPPRAISRVEPTYTEKARDAYRQGVVFLYVEITAEGRPQNIQVLRSLGLGLDESALESLRQWTFKPATKDGKPVTVMLVAEVNFSCCRDVER
jgi:TonB family protein